MVVGCGSDDTPEAASSPACSDEPISYEPLGGDRPVTPIVPDGYCHGQPTPLVIMLHGYGAGGLAQEAVIFQFESLAHELGFLYLYPDGTPDADGRKFWNATDACCNFDDLPIDDVAYLTGLIDEASQRFSVDPKRVYFVGHSNGGFMSHRMACDRSERVAAIAALAGSTPNQGCSPSEPVSVLQIHGSDDDTVLYDGGVLGAPYPGAEAIATLWRGIDGCNDSASAQSSLDYESSAAGAETERTRWAEGCRAYSAVELWKMNDTGHIPNFNDDARRAIVEFLLAQSKP